jgi:hypothetical protein
MRTGRMVDNVPPAARGSALKRYKLPCKHFTWRQFNRARIERRRKTGIEFRSGARRSLIGNSMPRKFRWNPCACIAITRDTGNPVRLQHFGIVRCNCRRITFATLNEIHHQPLILTVRNRKREFILAATGRIRKGNIADAISARQDQRLLTGGRVDDFNIEELLNVAAKLCQV